MSSLSSCRGTPRNSLYAGVIGRSVQTSSEDSLSDDFQVLYESTRTSWWYRILGIMCLSQLLFWVIISDIAYNFLREGSNFDDPLADISKRRRFALTSLLIGWAIAVAVYVLTTKLVNKAMYSRDAGVLRIITRSLTGMERTRDVPVSPTSLAIKSAIGPDMLPIDKSWLAFKVSRDMLWYIISRSGTFKASEQLLISLVSGCIPPKMSRQGQSKPTAVRFQ